ncbi:MAG: tetratricopeptide repeat protein [Gemmataceae bacterium]|nr:tetratricopeptide repeat protein [Gemmataceae bacterium]
MRCLVTLTLVVVLPAVAAGQTAEELAKQLQAATRAGNWNEAAEALTRLIELNPKDAPLYHALGCIEFRRLRFAASVAAFDKYIELRPEAQVTHWQRGISHYFAGQWDRGIAQFEGYQSYDRNDVENAVWRFLCMARRDGLAKARKELLPVGEDKRVPMRQIYDLFAGKLKPDDVLAAARTGEPTKDELNRRLFYAHLYVGIYLDLEGDKEAALTHLRKAAEEHRINHYMWDVGRVYCDVLRRQLPRP